MASASGPSDPLELLAAPAPDPYALLELAVEWDGLAGAEAQLAAALRLFVITRDPFEGAGDRGSAWATANADGETLELPVYITRDELRSRLSAAGGDLAAAVGPVCETVVLAAADSQGVVFAGAYPDLAHRGEVPRLLTRPGGPGRLGTPSVTVRSMDWEPIGLGAIQDLAQDAFGPVDLDRSIVALPPGDAVHPDCPACAGARFGFPGGLVEAQAAMCPYHRGQADDVTQSRIERARASNPAGWRAIGEGSERVSGNPEPAAEPGSAGVPSASAGWEGDPPEEDLGDLEPDEEQWVEEWGQADREAVELLRHALHDLQGAPAPEALADAASAARAGLAEAGHPFAWIAQAARLDHEPLPEDDADLLIRCVAATISPLEETGLETEEEATLLSLEHADWLGAIVSVVRAGPGADASPESLVDGIRHCPEVELESDLDLDEVTHLETAFWIVAGPWAALGLTDRDQRLTPLGSWLLPRALARAWDGDFDQQPTAD